MPETKIIATTGNLAVAIAMRQINPDVVAAYPITPQTPIMEEFAKFVADGVVDTELVRVESEHSAMSASIASAAAGARSMTATASQGLALMWEELYIASGLRLPIVLINVNRALSAPINIHCDHSDSMGARDSGLIQIYCENAQEGYDSTIMAVRIAEDERVHLPVMINYDGFTISHSIDRVEMLDDETVRQFVGEYNPPYNMLKEPITVGVFDSLGGFYYEFKYAQQQAMENALEVIEEVFSDFTRLSGRKYNHIDTEYTDDAEFVFVISGSMAGSVREVVNNLREKDIKAGLVKLRTFRPFPHRQLRNVLEGKKAVLVFDRAVSFGAQGGPLYLEIRSSLYDAASRPAVINFIYGLGGRDLELEEIERAFEIAREALDGKPVPEINWISIKGKEV